MTGPRQGGARMGWAKLAMPAGFPCFQKQSIKLFCWKWNNLVIFMVSYPKCEAGWSAANKSKVGVQTQCLLNGLRNSWESPVCLLRWPPKTQTVHGFLVKEFFCCSDLHYIICSHKQTNLATQTWCLIALPGMLTVPACADELCLSFATNANVPSSKFPCFIFAEDAQWMHIRLLHFCFLYTLSLDA